MDHIFEPNQNKLFLLLHLSGVLLSNKTNDLYSFSPLSHHTHICMLFGRYIVGVIKIPNSKEGHWGDLTQAMKSP